MNVLAETVRINISLVRKFLAQLHSLSGEGKMSRFFLEAAQEKVERQKWQAAFDRVLELPAILTGISDPVAWVDNLRAQDEDRLERSWYMNTTAYLAGGQQEEITYRHEPALLWKGNSRKSGRADIQLLLSILRQRTCVKITKE